MAHSASGCSIAQDILDVMRLLGEGHDRHMIVITSSYGLSDLKTDLQYMYKRRLVETLDVNLFLRLLARAP